MRVRHAIQQDAGTVAEIQVAGWRWAYPGIISEEELQALDVGARMRRFQERFDPQILFLVAVDDSDTPVGFAIETWPPQLPEFDAEIGGLYVHPDQTRSGLGRTLVKAMVEGFLRRRNRSMAIHTLQQNRIGRAFYERLGGALYLEDDWRGYPAVWYAWEDISHLVAS